MSETRLGIVIDAKNLTTKELREAAGNVKALQDAIVVAQGVVNKGFAGGEENIRQLNALLKEAQANYDALNRKAGIAAQSSLVIPEGSQQDIIRRLEASEARGQISGLVWQQGRYQARRFDEQEGAEGELATDIAAQRTREAKNQVFQSFRQDDALEHARVAQQRFESPFTSTGTAVGLQTDIISESQLKAVNTELERQLALTRQLGAAAGEYTSIQDAQLETKLAVLRAENAAMRRQGAEYGRPPGAVSEFETEKGIRSGAELANERIQAAKQAQEEILAFEIASDNAAAEHKLRTVQDVARKAAEEARREVQEEETAKLRTVTLEQQNRANISSSIGRHNQEQVELAQNAQMQRAAAAAMEEARSAAQGEAKSIEDVIKATTGAGQASAFTAAQIKEMSQGWPRASAGARAAGESLKGFSREAAAATQHGLGFGYALQRLAVEAGEYARGARGQMIASLTSTVRRVGVSGAVLPVGIPLAASLAALQIMRLNKEYGELAEKTLNAAAAAGMGVEQYSRLQRTLQLVSGDANHIVTVFGTLAESIEEAKTRPEGPRAAAFSQLLGPEFQQKLQLFEGHPDQLIDVLRQKFQELGPSIQTVDTYRRALGRGFQELMPIIRLTQQEWEEYSKRVQDAGIVMTEQTAKGLAKAAIESHTLTLELNSLGQAIAIAASNSGFISFLSSTVHWLREGWMAAAEYSQAIKTLPQISDKVARRTTDFTDPSIPALEPPGASSRAATPEESKKIVGSGAIPDFIPQAGDTAPPTNISILQNPLASASELEGDLNRQLTVIRQHASLVDAQRRLDIDLAQGNNNKVRQIEQQRIQEEQNAVEQEQALRNKYADVVAKRDASPEGQAVAEKIRDADEVQRRLVDIQAQAAQMNTRLNREEYREFAEGERDKIQAARGSWPQIAAIYQEWLNTIVSKYPMLRTEFETVQREMVRASQEATDKLIQDRIRFAETETNVLQSQSRLKVLSSEVGKVGQAVGRTDNIAAMRAEITELQSIAAQEEQIYQDIANVAGATNEQKIEAFQKAAQVAEETATKEIEIAKKIAEEQKKAAEEGSKAFVQFFDKAGSDAETLLDAAVFRSKTRQEAFRDFFLSIDKQILHTGESLLSQTAAQGLAKATGTELQPGKGLGDLLGQMVGKLFGVGEKPDAQAGIISAQAATTAQVAIANQILNQIRELESKQKAEVDQVKQTMGGGGGIQSQALGSVGTGAVPMEGEYAGKIQAAAAQYGIPPQVLYNLIRAESNFNPKAISSAGAKGLGQFTPETARQYGVDVNDPGSSISGSAHYIRDLYDQTGSYEKAISAYNRGPEGARKSGYSLSGYASYPKGQDLISAARTADMGGPTTPVPVVVVNGTSQSPAGSPAGSIGASSPNLVPGGAIGAIPNVNISRVGGSDIPAPSLAPTPPTQQAQKSPIQPTQSISDFLDYGFFGHEVGLNKPILKTGGKVPGFAQGGNLTPPNSSDTMLAWLTPGEFVVKKDSVDHYGSDFLHSLNSKSLPGFQSGGMADEYISSGPPFSIDPGIKLLSRLRNPAPEGLDPLFGVETPIKPVDMPYAFMRGKHPNVDILSRHGDVFGDSPRYSLKMFQSGGEVIDFPFGESPATQLQRRIQIEESKSNPDYSKIRGWRTEDLNLGRLWKPGMAPGYAEGGFTEEEVAANISQMMAPAIRAIGQIIKPDMAALQALPTVATSYLQQEQKMLAGEMSPGEMAGFGAQHIIGGMGNLSQFKDLDISKISPEGYRAWANARLSEKLQFEKTLDVHPQARERLFNEFSDLSRQYPLKLPTEVGTWEQGRKTQIASTGELWEPPQQALAFAYQTSRAKADASGMREPMNMIFFSERAAKMKPGPIMPGGYTVARGVEPTATHEYGHLIDWDLGMKGPSAAERVPMMAPSLYGFEGGPREWFAEAFTAARGYGDVQAQEAPATDVVRDLVGQEYRNWPKGEFPGFQDGGVIPQMIGEARSQNGLDLPPMAPGMYSSSGPSISSSIDPSLAFIHGTGANEAIQNQIQRAEHIGLSFGPGILKDVRLKYGGSTGSLSEGDMTTYNIISESKGHVGTAYIEKHGDTAEIGLIRSYLKSEVPGTESGFAAGYGVQSLGPTAIRNLAKQFFEENPDINRLTGFRVSGARERAGSAESNVELERSMFTKGPSRTYDITYFNPETMMVEQRGNLSRAEANRIQKEIDPEATIYPTMIPGYRFGGIIGFQSGGLAPIHPVSITSAGLPITTESRGFIHPSLQPVYPRPKYGLLAAIFGVGAGIAGLSVLASLGNKDDATAKKLLAAPDTPDTGTTKQTTTPLTQEQLDKFKDQDMTTSRYGWHWPGMAGGGLASDERMIKAQVGEGIVPRDMMKEVQTFHSGGMVGYNSGGFVWPAFQEGGEVNQITYSPPAAGQTSNQTTNVLTSVSNLSSSVNSLSQDITKVASGFTSLERASTPAAGAISNFTSELHSVSGAISTFNSILSLPKQIGSAAGGIGSFVGAIGSIFGLAEGGNLTVAGSGGTDSKLVQFMATPGETVSVMTPQQTKAMSTGGLPHFATGGIAQVEAISSGISNIVQGSSAPSYTGSGGKGNGPIGGNINNTFNISGVVNSHDVGRLFMQHFGVIAQAFQAGARHNMELPG